MDELIFTELGCVMLVLGYYFGSSIGSKDKQAQLDKIAGAK